MQPSTYEGILAGLLVSISSAQALEYKPTASCDSYSQAYKSSRNGQPVDIATDFWTARETH